VSIASEFQNLFAFLRDTAVDKALDQDIPLAGAALKPGKIADFVPGEDRIMLDDAIFRKLDPGVLPSKFFVHGNAAKDGNDHIGYDPGKGTVYYDKNGDKPGGYVALATLKKGLDIDAGDFLVV
jgi:hypothetical protein